MQRLFGVALIVPAVLLAGCSKVVVQHLDAKANAPAANGVIYALPKTVLRVQAKIDRTVAKNAPYSQYASIFAPDSKPVCPKKCADDGTITYSVQDGSTFSSFGEPDPKQVFLVKFSGAGAVDQSLTMAWNDSGLLSSASATVTNRTTDVIVSAIGAATTIASKSLFGAPDPNKQGATLAPTCEELSTKDTTVFTDIAAAIPSISSDVQAQLVNNYCSIAKTDRDGLDLTKLPAALRAYSRNVASLVQRRNNLLVNAAVVFDPTSLIARLDSEIATKLAPLFIGTKTTTTWNATIDTRNIPDTTTDPIPPVALFEFASNGVEVLKGEIPPEGVPEPDDFKKPVTNKEDARVLQLELSYRPAKTDQLFTKVVDDTHGDRSFRYRIPALVKVNLQDDKAKSYGGATIPIAQLGTIISLPADRHSKSLTYTLGMVEATGALKTFALSTTGGLDAGTMTSLGTATGTVLDARNTAAAAVDPNAALTKQDTLLKLQDDICTIQAKYNIPCTVQPK
ncbi:DUF4831 family protein [Terriglobus roseus]|uniref:Lipoprotein n=1 Tax=Terriglobus roseus TaxID=392734 RepID=A0A1G7L4K1_9BACT|nr:DUF4831 family protein [Terriglobus roseus]SDF44385.1 protein of unknown function [Terriglobus roseus]